MLGTTPRKRNRTQEHWQETRNSGPHVKRVHARGTNARRIRLAFVPWHCLPFACKTWRKRVKNARGVRQVVRTSHSIVREFRPHLSGALIPSSQYISVKAGLAHSCCIDLEEKFRAPRVSEKSGAFRPFMDSASARSGFSRARGVRTHECVEAFGCPSIGNGNGCRKCEWMHLPINGCICLLMDAMHRPRANDESMDAFAHQRVALWTDCEST